MATYTGSSGMYDPIQLVGVGGFMCSNVLKHAFETCQGLATPETNLGTLSADN